MCSVAKRDRKAEETLQGGLAAKRGWPRRLAASFAILGLYMQLAAAGFCTCCLPNLGGLAAAPPCHVHVYAAPTADAGHTALQANDALAQEALAHEALALDDHAQHDHAPAPHQNCPFCTVHCHAAMVQAPSIGVVQQTAALPVQLEPVPFIAPQAARFPAGAPPRGPPTSV